MLILLAKDRFFWTLRLSGRPLEETHRRTRWKVARIQGPVSVRYQHALKTLRQLAKKARAHRDTHLCAISRLVLRRLISPDMSLPPAEE